MNANSAISVFVGGTLALLAGNALGEVKTTSVNCDLVWTFTLQEDNAVRLYDKDFHTQHANLVGAIPYGTDGLLVYDEIEKKLILFDKAGRRIWAVGQEGSGPEDHYPSCEPILLQSTMIGLVSYSHEPKVIYYDADGAYLSSMALPGYQQFHRLIASGSEVYGLTHRSHGQISTGLEIEVYLAKVEAHGLSSQEILVKTANFKTWVKGMTVNEADFWTKPRVEAGPHGTVLVQPDVYAPVVEIFDPSLKKVLVIKGDWKPLPRPEAEIQAILAGAGGAKIPSPVCRALPHVFTVNDQEIWLQKTVADSSITFATYSTSGLPLGDVRLPERFDSGCKLGVQDNLLLCFEEKDVATDGTQEQVFSLFAMEVNR